MKNFENRACRRSFITFWGLFAVFTAFFWLFTGLTDGMAYALLFFCLGLPLSALGVSVVWGSQGDPWAYALPLLLCVSSPLLDLCTFRLIAFFAGNPLYAPDWTFAPLVLLCSAVGLGIGRLWRFLLRRRKAA